MNVVAQARASLDDQRLTLTVKTDFSEFRDHLSRADGTTGVNPAFDPHHSSLSPDASFWISAEEQEGGIASCIAYRTFHTHDVRDLIRTMEIFCEGPCATHTGTMDLVIPEETPHISGLVGFPGGLWVRSDYRGNGLSAHMMRAVRNEALHRYLLDWEVAITFQNITESASMRDIYNFQDVVPCVDGYFPPTQRAERIALQYSSRTHLIRNLAGPGRAHRRPAHGSRLPTGPGGPAVACRTSPLHRSPRT
ncbi:GNAT family N-acetyltransferase [Streptomyces celluloflavus]|uniref:hypothetical protein n=1 Tax=Streptomyces celluloflavus TaxID=58344 RepID=UPI0036655DD1